MTLEQLRPYCLGAYYATIATQKKLKDSSPTGKTSYKKVSNYQKLIDEYRKRSRRLRRRKLTLS